MRTPVSLEDVLVKGRCSRLGISTDNQWLKKRLIKDSLMEDRCVDCGIGPLWQGQPITLQLDHDDGDWDNNLIENLKIRCPNCHSQRPTSFGRNRGKARPNRPGKRPGHREASKNLGRIAESWRDEYQEEDVDSFTLGYLSDLYSE